MLKIKVNTKSNYKNANHKELEVVELLGTIIAARVPEYGYDENGNPNGFYITSDFNQNEVYWMKEIK